jgi:hypothetical protein
MIRILLLFLLLPFTVTAQDKFDKSKNQVKKELDQFVADNPGQKMSVTQTDSTVNLYRMDPKAGLVQITYGFNKNDKCSQETVKASCDSCIRSLFRSVLDRSSFQWKKINENQYVSKYEDRILIELPVDPDDYSFMLFRAQWTKEIYDILLKQ